MEGACMWHKLLCRFRRQSHSRGFLTGTAPAGDRYGFAEGARSSSSSTCPRGPSTSILRQPKGCSENIWRWPPTTSSSCLVLPPSTSKSDN